MLCTAILRGKAPRSAVVLIFTACSSLPAFEKEISFSRAGNLKLGKLFELLAFFVRLNFLAKITVLFEIELLRSIQFVPFSYIVNILTNGTLKPKRKTCSF